MNLDTNQYGGDTTLMLISYSVYLLLSIGLTVWVARTLHKNGRAFLVDAFLGNEEMADSVNHLLVVGFYLVNLGWVCLHLRSYELQNAVRAFEMLAGKMGVVLLSLGAMHFFNLYVLNRYRKRALLTKAPPPVAPTGRTRLGDVGELDDCAACAA